MTVEEFKVAAEESGFCNFPEVVDVEDCQLRDFVTYEDCDDELKVYLASLILSRNFPPTRWVVYIDDVYWFIEGFLKDYKEDYQRSWITEAVKDAIHLIRFGNTFTTKIFATTYLFGIIEFHAKWLLGFRPPPVNKNTGFHNQNKFEDMTITTAFNKIRKQNTQLACRLNFIDQNIKEFFKKRPDMNVREDMKPTIAERLGYARNHMLHGHNHNFFSEGFYLTMLYALFHLSNERMPQYTDH